MKIPTQRQLENTELHAAQESQHLVLTDTPRARIDGGKRRLRPYLRKTGMCLVENCCREAVCFEAVE